MQSVLQRLSPVQLIVASFAALILLGAVLLSMPVAAADGRLSFLDALFTSTSAVCVTGLAVISTGGDLSGVGQVILLALIQVGGFGVLTAGTLLALATGRRIGMGERLRLQQQVNSLDVGGVIDLIRRIALIVLVTEVVGALLLYIRFAAVDGPAAGVWQAIFHSVSAFNNAGFSLHDDSLSRFIGDPLVNTVVMLLIIIGGLGFVVLVELGRRTARQGSPIPLTLHTKMVIASTTVLLLLGFVAIIVFEWQNAATLGSHGTLTKLQASAFASVTPRTAGFNTVDYADMRPATLLLTMLLMFVGGSPGSTAGGIKTVTFWVMAVSIWSVLRGRGDAVAHGRRLPADTVVRAGAIAFCALMTGGAALTVLAFTEPHVGFLSLMFEAISALATVGLSMGATTQVGEAGKLMLIALMFLGRVGFLTFALALVQRRPGHGIRMLREEVVIG